MMNPHERSALIAAQEARVMSGPHKKEAAWNMTPEDRVTIIRYTAIGGGIFLGYWVGGFGGAILGLITGLLLANTARSWAPALGVIVLYLIFAVLGLAIFGSVLWAIIAFWGAR
jgi:hypothetical protein